jgi:hypothetical protein
MLLGIRRKANSFSQNQSLKISASGYIPLALIALEFQTTKCFAIKNREVQ